MKAGEGSRTHRYGEADSDRAPYIWAAAVAAASFPRSADSSLLAPVSHPGTAWPAGFFCAPNTHLMRCATGRRSCL
jgi:hypothetical protein